MVNARLEIERFVIEAIKALMRQHPSAEVRGMCARVLDEWEVDAEPESQMLPRQRRDDLPPWTG
jgi:hypothetical protein